VAWRENPHAAEYCQPGDHHLNILTLTQDGKFTFGLLAVFFLLKSFSGI